MYLGAFAKLGASLGRDGDLPRWLSAGAETGGIPRRALAVVAVLCLGYMLALVATGLDLTPFILIHTSNMIAIYVIGMLAAVRLLARYTVGWWMGCASLVLSVGLAVLAGPNLVYPAVLAVAAVVVTLVSRRSP
jgi:amino acid efflux transporter